MAKFVLCFLIVFSPSSEGDKKCFLIPANLKRGVKSLLATMWKAMFEVLKTCKSALTLVKLSSFGPTLPRARRSICEFDESEIIIVAQAAFTASVTTTISALHSFVLLFGKTCFLREFRSAIRVELQFVSRHTIALFRENLTLMPASACDRLDPIIGTWPETFVHIEPELAEQ